VTLNSPSNSSTIQACIPFNFTFTPSFYGYYGTINDSRLYVYSGSGLYASVVNSSAVISDALNGISYTIPQVGTYYWNIRISNSSLGVYASSNYTLSVSSDIQDFYINDTWAGHPANFEFNLTDTSGLDHAIFNSNVTGTPANCTTLSMVGNATYWANFTVTLPNYNCIVNFTVWVWNTSAVSATATIGERCVKVYTYNSTEDAWNTPFEYLGSAIETIETRNVWNGVDTYTQAVLNQQPVSALPTMIDNYALGAPSSESYVYIDSSTASGWTSSGLSCDNDTGTDAYTSWTGTGRSAYLILNLTTVAKGTQINYFVGRQSTTINQMNIEISNSTGGWTQVYSGSFSVNNYYNVSIPQSQYTAMRLSFNKTGEWNYQAYAYEMRAINGTFSAGGGDWGNVMSWSAICNKPSIVEQTSINLALNGFTMCGSLPQEGTDSKSNPVFDIRYKHGLYGFYYANQSWAITYNSSITTKWNITAAFQEFNSSIYTFGKPASYIYANGTATLIGLPRWYDECASTIECYLIFAEILNVSGALADALHWWDWINVHVWVSDSPSHFRYQADSSATWECEAPYFLKIISELKYYYPSLQNWSYVLTDIGNRFLTNEWLSAGWLDNVSATTFVITHAPYLNPQRRLQNTLAVWQALLGVYMQFSSPYQNDMRDMLYGNLNTEPAWALLLTPQASLYDSINHLFKLLSTDSVTDYAATAYAEIMMFMMGIVPHTATLAFPLEELSYEYIYDIDPYVLAFNWNLMTQEVSLPINNAGTIIFQYGTSPVICNFAQSGVWKVKFSSSWNMILSVTFVSELPNNTIYFSQTTYTSLTYGWNGFLAWQVDNGQTLGTINASLNSQSIDWSIITVDFLNGTQRSLVCNTSYNSEITVASGSELFIYCLDLAAIWHHTYR
jgi:hypothetical protein